MKKNLFKHNKDLATIAALSLTRQKGTFFEPFPHWRSGISIENQWRCHRYNSEPPPPPHSPPLKNHQQKCVEGTVIKRRCIPLVVGSDQAGPVDGQDPIANPQPAIGCRRPVGDERADVDARGVEGRVLRWEGGGGRKGTVTNQILKNVFF